jgi:hypothetical protein
VLDTVTGQGIGRSHAVAINDSSETVGDVYLGGHLDNYRRAARWAADGSAMLLGELPGQTTTSSEAEDISSTGLVVGQVRLSGVVGSRAMLWDAAGNASLLQDLMSDGNSWVLTSALGIDTSETTLRVLAQGTKNGGPSAWYLLDAVIPEPVGAGTLPWALLTLLTRCRKQKAGNRERDSLDASEASCLPTPRS